MKTMSDALPCAVDVERYILGSAVMDKVHPEPFFSHLTVEDFILEKHRRIFAAMQDMDQKGITIDRVTLARHLMDLGQLESVDGLSYLTALDAGLPDHPNVDRYTEILREKTALRKIIYCCQNLMTRCYCAGENPRDLMQFAEEKLTEIEYRPRETARGMSIAEIIDQCGGLDKFLSQQSDGVRTPWTGLTEMTGGYRSGELWVLAGNPSMGKSAAALQVAATVAGQGKAVMIFSLEMSRKVMFQRMACTRAGINGAKFRNGYIGSEGRAQLRDAINEITSLPLSIFEHGISTVSAIRSAVRKKKVTNPDLFMIVIDYLQLLQGIGKAGNRNEEISEITRQLKLLAMEEKINIHLLSQLNRENLRERRQPQLHDLRESGSIEQDADCVAFVWRPEMLFRDREDLKGQAQLLLWKQREGPTGQINLQWLHHLGKFVTPSDDMGPDPN